MRQFLNFIAFWVLAGNAVAAPPSDKSINELLVLTKAEMLLQNMASTVEQQVRQSVAAQISDKKLTPEQTGLLEAKVDKAIAIVREELGWKQQQAQLIAIYKESFTQAEINGLVAFYKTPVGKAAIEKMPVVLQKSMAMAQARMGPLSQKISAVFAEGGDPGKDGR